MRSEARALPCVLLLALAACGGGGPRSLQASITSVEPSCGDVGADTPVVVHGEMPVKVTASLSGGGSSTADATYRAWLGDRELAGVTWSGPQALDATVPAGLAPGDYPLTVETPFGERVTKDAAFHVQAGPCAPSSTPRVTATATAPDHVSVGQSFTYTMTVTNGGAAAALVTPDVGISGGGGTAPATVVTAPPPRTVAAGAQQRFDFALRATAAGTATLTGALTAADAGTQQPIDASPPAPVQVNVQRSTALTTSVTAAPAVVASGDTVTVTAHVQNDGQATADAVAATVASAPPGFVAVPPLPPAQAIPGGAARDFAFTYRAGPGAGSGTFAVDASGVDVNSHAPVTALRATSGPVAASYHVGGTVNGLAGGAVALQLNGGNELRISANGSFAFGPLLASGTGFTVTVSAQPTGPSQTCTLSGATGTVGTADVTTVSVTCSANRFTVGGAVSGLAGAGLVLHDAGSNQDARPSGDGAWAFPSPVPSGSGYAVTVTTQPSNPSQSCSVANGTGTVGGANVTNVNVTCATRTFTVGGTISGLTASGLVLHQGTEDLHPAAGATSFTFTTPVPSGGAYAVTATAQPVGQTCTVSNGTGTVGSADVTSVAVGCAVAVVPLSVTTGGTGAGAVSCNGGPCPTSAPYGTVITVTAVPDAGSTFAGWIGDCAGAGLGPCTIQMTAAHATTAVFSPAP